MGGCLKKRRRENASLRHEALMYYIWEKEREICIRCCAWLLLQGFSCVVVEVGVSVFVVEDAFLL